MAFGLKKVSVALLVSTCLACSVAPASAQLFGKSNEETAQNTARLVQLEDQVRQLTGRIEEMGHQIRTLEDQNRRMQEDNEYRLQQLEEKAGISPPVALKQPEATAVSPGPNGQSQANSGAALKQNPAVNTQGQGGNGGPLDLSALGGQANVAVQGGQSDVASGQFSGDVNSLLTGDAKADYNAIYGLLVDGHYAAAAKGFDTYLGMYPDFEMAPNAQHWLGESYLAQKNYQKAAEAFLKSYTDYPESELAPNSLLKLGNSLIALGNKDTACATFDELLKVYPFAQPNILQRTKEEKKQAQCS
ncbi:tol-pal system protein YbgF [Polycladidibacter stylochi]|uniref:tol-pal system protein YbgF n=1 Tax=Polycladidibacter stylochi TaxID=1807766 RepID=UPI00082C960F|nr:tol-pal system protein YbgF [Pseudovibrio stylochi]